MRRNQWRSQQRSCFQTHISSRNGLWNFLRMTRGRLKISFRNTAIMPSSVTRCLWTGSCRTLETTGEFQPFMETFWRSWWIHQFSFCYCSVDALAVNIHTICPPSAWYWFIWMRLCLSFKEPFAASSTELQPTCSKRSYWWTTTAEMVCFSQNLIKSYSYRCIL